MILIVGFNYLPLAVKLVEPKTINFGFQLFTVSSIYKSKFIISILARFHINTMGCWWVCGWVTSYLDR